MGLIYRAISPLGKIYVGKTTESLPARQSRHKREAFCKNNQNKFYRALRKYGFDCFKWEIIENNIPDFLLNIKECEYVEIFKSFRFGYNSTLGGEGICGKRHTIESKRKISENHVGMTGKKHSEETKSIMSVNFKEKWNKKGYKDNMSLKFSGENNPMYGRVKGDSPIYRGEISWKNICNAAIINNYQRNKTAEFLGCNRSTIRNRILEKGFKNWNDFCLILKSVGGMDYDSLTQRVY